MRASHSALKAVACLLPENRGQGNRLAATTDAQTMLCVNIALPIQAVTQTAA